MKPILLVCSLLICFNSQGQKTLLPQLNSKARETNLSISPNGKYLYFMSTQGGQPWSEFRKEEKGVKQYDGDIWYSFNQDGEWQSPVCLDHSINTDRGEDEPNITADGQRVYFQSFRNHYEYNGGPYFMATLNGVLWENPVGLGGEITRFFSDLDTRTDIHLKKRLREANLFEYYQKLKMKGLKEDQWKDSLSQKGFKTTDFWIATDGMAISPDENIFIVSAYNPEAGNYDLWISRKNEEGLWSYPKSLNINSSGDEKSVFIAADNQTVYFASNKAGGLGGLDIYKTTLLSGTQCTAPVSLGSNFNTPQDDNGLILDASGKNGFMTSNGDIYQVKMDMELPRSIVINGIVIDQDKNPVYSNINLFKTDRKIALGRSTSNARSGAYSFSFKREEGSFKQVFRTLEGQTLDTIFEVNTKTPDVLDFVIMINLPKKDTAKIVTLMKGKLHKNEIFRIDQLKFDADKSVIKPENYGMLNELASILRMREKVVIEIGGHTNALANDQFSEKLSTERALAVYNYLLGQKVPLKNLQYKGYGKKYPIAPNTTEKRYLNQRVEIKILETD